MLNKLTLTFEVNDDLTSERIAEYRATVIHALNFAMSNADWDARQHDGHFSLTDKLLNDVNECSEDKGFGQYIKPDGTIFDAHGPVNTEENFEVCLALFLSMAQDKIDIYMATSFPSLEVPQLVLDRNRKYIRVVKDRHGDKSVYCFINTENGDILKGSWKAPVKNGVRGSIFSGDHGADRVTHHGCAYLR